MIGRRLGDTTEFKDGTSPCNDDKGRSEMQRVGAMTKSSRRIREQCGVLDCAVRIDLQLYTTLVQICG